MALWLGALLLGACELDETVAVGGEPMVVVSAIMRPDLPGQHVIVERTLTGGVEVPDSGDIPIPPRAPRIPIEFALVTVTNLDLPGDPCGQPVGFSATPYDPAAVAAPGIYWSPPGCPTMRPGDRLQLRVETPDGEIVTGTTQVPGMHAAFLAVAGDSAVLGGGDSVLTFNRDRDTLRFGVDAIVGRLVQLDVRRHGYLSDAWECCFTSLCTIYQKHEWKLTEVPMFRRFSMLFILILTLSGLPVGVASAQDMPSLDLPPGIAAQAQPLLEAMMERMQQSGMSHDQMQMMMVDTQAMTDQLPPGIFLNILELMLELDMADMMSLHQQIHRGGLLEQPPGQILKVVKKLAG